MANVIALAKKYLPLLDEIYQRSALTSILDAKPEWVRNSENANEVLIPKVTVDGLADYDKAGGFVAGSANFSWETFQLTQDRGRSFTIDTMDNEETINTAVGAISGQFMRTEVIPEVDAYRFAVMADLAGTKVDADLTKDTAIQALDAGREAMLNASVNLSSVITFVSPKVYTFLKQSSLIVRQLVVNAGNASINREIETLDGSPIIVVPQDRFYDSITLYDGTTGGQTAGGYVKAVGALDINFLLVDTNAVMGLKKHAKPRLFNPDQNINADAFKYDYRLYHDMLVFANKTKGIYLHTEASGS